MIVILVSTSWTLGSHRRDEAEAEARLPAGISSFDMPGLVLIYWLQLIQTMHIMVKAAGDRPLKQKSIDHWTIAKPVRGLRYSRLKCSG